MVPRSLGLLSWYSDGPCGFQVEILSLYQGINETPQDSAVITEKFFHIIQPKDSSVQLSRHCACTERYLITRKQTFFYWVNDPFWQMIVSVVSLPPPRYQHCPLQCLRDLKIPQKGREIEKKQFCCYITKSCPNLCDPMDCSPPSSFVHGIFQARILEWVVISFFRGSSRPRDWTHVSCLAGGFFTTEPPGKPNLGETRSHSFSFRRTIV